MIGLHCKKITLTGHGNYTLLNISRV